MDASLSPAALVFLFLALIAIFTVPRKMVILPVLVCTVLMTIGQSINILGANFYFLRIVIIAAWIRIIMRREASSLVLNPVDKAFLMWAGYAILIGFVPKFRDPREVIPPATFLSTFINKGGFTLDSLGAYFLARHLLRDMKDVMYAIRVLILISLVLACFMTIEKVTGRNLFSVFGVVPEFTVIRAGKLRCQGPFTHPIHAGDYGATLMPLCVGLWFCGWKKFAMLGFAGSAMVTIASSSSGPLLSCIYGMSAFFLWGLRYRMHLVRRGILLLILVLHFTMTAPVWWAISRVADFTGGGGYWRSKLIDTFVFSYDEWILLGTNYTAHWSPTGMGLAVWPDHMDLTNQYVSEGVHGGLLQLILFVTIMVRCFSRVGSSIKLAGPNHEHRYLYWSLGCCLVAYMTSFLSVAGSMQSDILYFTFLAFVATIPLPAPKPIEPVESEPKLKVATSVS